MPAPAPAAIALLTDDRSDAVPILAGTPAPARLSPAAAAALAAGVPPATSRAYAGDWKRFTAWCAEHGHAALPASAEVLTEYATHLAYTLHRAPATIERAVAAIRVAHQSAGAPPPATVGARLVLRGYRDALKTAQDPATRRRARPRQAAPALPTTLRTMVATLDRDTPIGARDACLLLLGFALAARRSELVALDLADITLADHGLDVTVDRRKTHTDGPVAVLHGSDPATCPVRATRAWLDQLADAGLTSGPLLVRVDRHGFLAPALTRAGRPIGDPTGRLSGQAVADVVARTATAADLDHSPGPDAPAPLWAGHSLRRGLATAARRAGHDLVRIGRHGGWADGSRALLRYLEDADRVTDNPLIGVGL